MKKICRGIAVAMLIGALLFVGFACVHPEMSFPWSNTITYSIYGGYLLSILLLWIVPTAGNKSRENQGKEIVSLTGKEKTILSVAFVVSLFPMLLNQYGGCRGVQEISGLINVYNPIGFLSIVLFCAGVFMSVKKQWMQNGLLFAGCAGIVCAELYQYFTWYTHTIYHKISLQMSIQFAFPAFYVGLLCSVCMMAACLLFLIRKESGL